MSNSILIIGESGTGKSTSIRNLDAESTFLISVISKPLPFPGWRKKYTKVAEQNSGGNYYVTDNWTSIVKIIKAVDTKKQHIKTLIIDDLQYILASEYMSRALEKGYGKFSELAQHFWTVLRCAENVRDDLTCVFMSHSDIDVNGKAKIKTIGKMLDEKITIEGLFTTVLHSMRTESGYKFLTQGNDNYTAKSPMGMFVDEFIDNDLDVVLKVMQQYDND
jgi:hypothetical protein